MTGLLEALRPVLVLLLGVLLELFRRRAWPTSEDADPDTETHDKLRAKVREHWSES